VHFTITPGQPDYYPELPGGKVSGRSIEPLPFNSQRLRSWRRKVRPSNIKPPMGMGLTAYEAHEMYMLTRSLSAQFFGLNVFLANLLFILTGGQRWTLGRGLVGRLLLSLVENKIPLWNNTSARELVLEEGIVTGVNAEKEGQSVRIRARKGVLLAAGGFEHNQEMREQYLPKPTNANWSAANPANTGDAIRMGQAIGAALDLMDDAWWIPSGLPPDEPPIILVGERSFPRQVIVNSAGQRFINEATPYHQFGQVMYAKNQEGSSTIPAYMVFDRRYRNRYIFGQTLPFLTPIKFIESGYFRRKSSLRDLAEQVGIDPGGLVETIQRFNRFAVEGKDPQFGRGESALDRYYGDPTSRPNPCLGPIDTPPFYAVALYPGDLGTKGGLLTDEWARVLRLDGAPIGGLYACGNTSASVMGNSYPGAGATIGPAMTFGYISALHASGEVG